MDPGTAAIATLATLAGVSGYGAMKVNKNQDIVIEQKVQERIAQTEERLKDTQEALQAVEAVKTKQAAQLAAIQKELDMLRSARSTVESVPPPKKISSRFFPSFGRKPIERDFTPVVTANPEDVTPMITPEPTLVAAPPLEPETVEAPKRTLPEEPEERLSFTPEPIEERLRIAKERAAKMKQDNGSSLFMNRLDDAKNEALQDIKQFPSFTVPPPITETFPETVPPPITETFPETVPLYSFTPPTASVPATNRQTPPPIPPVNAKRRTQRKPIRPPTLPQGGSRRTRKKKLRTRRGSKQRNVGRARGR
jgi:hypothetical protein